MTGREEFDGWDIADLRDRIASLDEEIAERQAERTDLRAALHRRLYANSAAARRLTTPRDRRTGRPLRNPPHPALPPERD